MYVYVFSLYNVDTSHGVECSQAHGKCLGDFLGDGPHGDRQVPRQQQYSFSYAFNTEYCEAFVKPTGDNASANI